MKWNSLGQPKSEIIYQSPSQAKGIWLGENLQLIKKK